MFHLETNTRLHFTALPFFSFHYPCCIRAIKVVSEQPKQIISHERTLCQDLSKCFAVVHHHHTVAAMMLMMSAKSVVIICCWYFVVDTSKSQGKVVNLQPSSSLICNTCCKCLCVHWADCTMEILKTGPKQPGKNETDYVLFSLCMHCLYAFECIKESRVSSKYFWRQHKTSKIREQSGYDNTLMRELHPWLCST